MRLLAIGLLATASQLSGCATAAGTILVPHYVATPIMSTGGVLLMLSGVRSYAPSSPAELPALPRR